MDVDVEEEERSTGCYRDESYVTVRLVAAAAVEAGRRSKSERWENEKKKVEIVNVEEEKPGSVEAPAEAHFASLDDLTTDECEKAANNAYFGANSLARPSLKQ